MRVHCVSLPHVDLTGAHCWCAYGGKLRRWPAMLQAQGHEVVMYGSADTEADADEHVVVVTDADRHRWFGGPWDEGRVFDRWEPADQCWVEMNKRAAVCIQDRIAPGDAVAIVAGRCQQMVVDAFPNNISLEPFVGYVGVLPNTFRCFESRMHQAYVSGWYHDDNGRFFDTVIPNAYDPAEFSYTPSDKDDYLLYLGRMTPRKGLAVVEELAKKHRVITAGQGDERVAGAEHVGIVRGAMKRELLARARAVLVPTTYLEPFGGVAVEAMMSGTPVITTDFGAFVETVEHGKTGFRCSTLAEFHRAADDVDNLDPAYCRLWALSRYSLGVVGPMYDAWLRQVGTLYSDGWYQT